MSDANTNGQEFDLKKLLKEAGDVVDSLIKSEKEKQEVLQKKEESSKEESSKEESSVEKKEDSSKKEESMKKDEPASPENSGYESQAPEASSPSPEDSQGQDQMESLESMVSSLDEQMLQELKQVVDMELSARSQQQQPAPEASPAPTQPEAAPPQQDMAMKSEVEALKEKLVKSEEKSANVEKAFGLMSDLMEKMINKPVDKAITDIQSIAYIDKGEQELKKSENSTVSDEDLKKKLTAISGDNKELAKLTKSEREAMTEYFVTKKRNPEVLKIVTK